MTDHRPIRHVVFFSSKHPDNIEAMIKGLTMLQDIPSLRHFEVRRNRNEDRYANEVDIIVYAEFDDADALAAYRAHPVYQKCVEVVRPLRDLRIAADF